MSLLENIRQKSIEARKAKDAAAASLLVTLLSEAAMVGKNANRETTDAETMAIVKKFIKNNDETIGRISDPTAIAALTAENAIMQQFLPTQLSGDELSSIVSGLIAETGSSTAKDMGRVMKLLKERHDGSYDSKIASDLIKSQLN